MSDFGEISVPEEEALLGHTSHLAELTMLLPISESRRLRILATLLLTELSDVIDVQSPLSSGAGSFESLAEYKARAQMEAGYAQGLIAALDFEMSDRMASYQVDSSIALQNAEVFFRSTYNTHRLAELLLRRGTLCLFDAQGYCLRSDSQHDGTAYDLALRYADTCLREAHNLVSNDPHLFSYILLARLKYCLLRGQDSDSLAFARMLGSNLHKVNDEGLAAAFQSINPLEKCGDLIHAVTREVAVYVQRQVDGL